ncbi:helicase POLQ-like isoform X1 [Daphnia pulex]|uniref:helicase POLQ-like isoform X1 n=2 Tax=Daphnia pulex TaxID=6669 RepID=UPI001EE0B8F6|nr:helicase POLQ-like isoform X1 [Daphnia pulex]XP_046445476.1 helicase POLQ-like isoform X1 [Daphnia pulex]
MNAKNFTAFATRKRIRERDNSPDMFAAADEDEDVISSDKETKQDSKKSLICKTPSKDLTKLRPSSKSYLQSQQSSREQSPKQNILLSSSVQHHDNNNQSMLSSDSKVLGDCSMSSLRSTLNTNHFGLNSRMKEALHYGGLNNTRIGCSSRSSSGETPPIYTLNNSNILPSQTSIHCGPHYGLSVGVWQAIQQTKGINSLYDWQDKCLNKAIKTNQNLLYSLPTSGGKTLVAEILMVRELLCNQNHCLFVMPYVSIVQEKIRTLSSLAIALNFAVEEYAGNRGSYPPRKRKSKRVIYIATLEKANGIVNSLLELGRLNEIGLVVVDEIHIVGEGKRGATLETLLCKLLLAPVGPRLVAMSATIGNIDELSNFLKAEIYTEDFRPVQLREFIKTGDQVLEVSGRQRGFQENFKHCRSVSSLSAESRKNDPDGISALVSEVAPEHCCLVFCSTKKNCESVAKLISSNLSPNLLQWKTAEKLKLRRALEQESGRLCPILKSTLPFGIAYHHSGLTADERQLIEEAFSSGTLCCLCCTSTLAAGVNLPARRVILRSPYIGNTRLTRARYQQMIGRAGRAGFDTHGESFMIVKPNELTFVTNDILMAPTNRVDSQLAEDNLRGLQQLLLSLISLDLGGRDRKTLAETLLHSTLLGQQSTRQTITATELVDQSLNSMAEKNLILFGKDEKLEVTKLGRATLKGIVDLDRSKQLYNDLRLAQAGLVLMTKLHLMYLVTPYDMVGTVIPIASTYFQSFNKLSAEELGVARTIGINETVMVKLMSNQQPKIERSVLERFYLTLMLNDLFKGESVWNVSELYGCTRGDVQNLLSSASSFASCVFHFVQELDEFWAFSDLLLPFSRELSMCCTAELIPLMELPSVGKGRARMLFKAGFRTLTDVAKTNPEELVSRVDHLPKRSALQMIAAAKVLVYEKADALREEADSLLELVPRPQPLVPLDETFQTQASNVSLLDD